MSDAAETALKMELMRVDILLKNKQAFWETPRNIAVLMGTVAAIVAAGAGFIGFKIGQQPGQQPIVIYMPNPPQPAVK